MRRLTAVVVVAEAAVGAGSSFGVDMNRVGEGALARALSAAVPVAKQRARFSQECAALLPVSASPDFQHRQDLHRQIFERNFRQYLK